MRCPVRRVIVVLAVVSPPSAVLTMALAAASPGSTAADSVRIGPSSVRVGPVSTRAETLRADVSLTKRGRANGTASGAGQTDHWAALPANSELAAAPKGHNVAVARIAFSGAAPAQPCARSPPVNG